MPRFIIEKVKEGIADKTIYNQEEIIEKVNGIEEDNKALQQQRIEIIERINQDTAVIKQIEYKLQYNFWFIDQVKKLATVRRRKKRKVKK